MGDRIRRRTWSQDTNPFVERQPMVRRGPLCLGLGLLMVIPILIVSFSDSTIPKDQKINHAWIPTGIYRGPRHKYYLSTYSKVVAETESALCQIDSIQSPEGKDNDWLFLQQPNKVSVIIVTEDSKWILQRVPRYVLSEDGLSIPQLPVSVWEGDIIDTLKETPLMAAIRVVQEKVGYTNLLKDIDNSNLKALNDGSIPYPLKKLWTFLGRFPTMADRGGGIVYCYLLKVSNVGEPSFKQGDSSTMSTPFVMTSDQVGELLLEGIGLADLATTTTVSLAFHHAKRVLT